MFDEVQKLVPWAQQLPLIAKVTLTAIIVFAAFLIISLVWATPKKVDAFANSDVQVAYNRMLKVLSRLQKNDKGVFVDGREIPKAQEEYWSPYLSIQAVVHDKPGDLGAAYESVMENGGDSRIFTSDTQSFETVVSGFARQVEVVSRTAAPQTKN
jgi:hypothetical protein